MKSPALETTTDNSPILIVDKLGLVGKAIADNLETQQPVFFASGRNGEVLEEKNKNIVFLKYPQNKNKIPSIPNFSYAYFFIVWNGEKEILESLPEFIKKSKEEKAKFIFIANLFTAKETLIKKIKSAHPDGKIIILGDLFGKPVSVKTHSPINKIIYQAFLNKKIRLENAGLGRLYPVFFEDAIKILLEIVLNEKKESPGVYFLFPKYPSTQLSFSRILQKIDPLIAVDFSNKISGEEPAVPGEGNYALSENYSLRGKIDQLLEELDISEDIDEEKIINSSERMTMPSGKNNEDKKRKRNIFLPFIIFILLAIFLPVITTVVFSLLGVKLLSDTKDNLEKGKYELAYKDILLSQKSFNFAETSSSLLVSEAKLIGKENDVRSVVSNIQTGKDVSAAAGFSLNALLKFEGTFLGKSLNPKDDFVDGLNNLKDALRIFQKMQSKNPDNGIEKKLFSIINSYNSSIKIVANTADVLPVLFGFDNKKTYLVLFQNNMELRPGGGFIGSYGILNLDKGKVESFNLHDVYDADGQLKGHIEPPFAIRRYIPLVHLYLRDSNFDVDFSNSASSSAYMLNQEMGQIVDGVIAVDTSFVKTLLEALGPVYVSEYNETVSKDNFYLLTQRHAEKNSFPGSSQKKDFLRSLFNSMQLSLSSKKNIPYLKMLDLVGNSIFEKHVLFAFSDPTIQNLFTANNMSSSLVDNRENGTNIINDFIGINEANLGVNKTNYFIKRKISHEINISNEGKATGKVNILYKNTSQKGVWPGGDYKNYLRVILPFGAEISSISIDGEEQKMVKAITDPATYESKNFIPPSGLEVEKKIENGKTIYGFLINVPTEELKTVTVSYVLPQTVLPSIGSFVYDLLVFKQPGTDEDSFSSIIHYPSVFKVTNNLMSEVKLSDGEVAFSKNLLRDLSLRINFSKK